MKLRVKEEYIAARVWEKLGVYNTSSSKVTLV
jgi:hypothetical protein